MKRIIWMLFIEMLLLYSFPALRAQSIDYLTKAKEFLDQGDCERARLAYEDYRKNVNSNGNAEVKRRIEECGKTKPCPNAPTVTDYDGNVYRTVQIGSQCWMAENLRVEHNRYGKLITLGEDLSWEIPCYYPASIGLGYGYLYNWKAAINACPLGWHLPTDAEWAQMLDYVSLQSQFVNGGEKDCIAKSLASKKGWSGSSTGDYKVGNNLSENNATGFSAFPAGEWSKGEIPIIDDGKYLFSVYAGDMYITSLHAYFWSSTAVNQFQAFCRSISFSDCQVKKEENYQFYGLSVRCVKD